MTIEISPKENTNETREWKIKDTDRRALPLTEDVSYLLADLQNRRLEGYPYVFVPPERYDHIQQQLRPKDQWSMSSAINKVVNNFTRQFDKILSMAHVDKGTFHDIRRTAITNWFRQGLSEYDVMTLAGLAKNPRGDDSFASCEFCQATANWYREAISVLEKQSKTPVASSQTTLESEHGWRVPPCIKAIEEATIPDGTRHNLYTDLSRYFAFLGMHPLEILERIQKIDSRNPIPDPTSIERSVRWGYAHPGFPGCNSASLRKYCKKEICFYAELKTGKQM